MQTLLHSREVNKLKGNLRFNSFLYSKTEMYLVYNEKKGRKTFHFSCLINLRQKMFLLKNRQKTLIFNISSIGNQQTQSVKQDFVTTP